MDTGRISARYAKALYEFASENQKADAIYSTMKVVADSFAKVPELTKALVNPQVSTEKKKGLLLASAGSEVCNEFEKFVDLVLSHKREAFFNQMSLVYQDIYRKEKNIVISKVVSAAPLPEKETESIKKLVKEKMNAEIDLVTEVNPDIIGGFVINVGTYQLDASVSSQLRMIKDSLLKSNSSAQS